MSFRERIEFINIIYSLFRVFIIYVFIIQFMITIDFWISRIDDFIFLFLWYFVTVYLFCRELLCVLYKELF